MGRVPFCECGIISFWTSQVAGSQTSQQFTDVYTFSHFLHGILFYGVLYLVSKKYKLSFGAMLIIGTMIEAGWEILENTSFIIERYRAATISRDYYGDSIFNVVGDMFFMVVGFIFAARVSWWVSLMVFIAVEGALLYFIRDNLTLNIVMLLYPIDAIRVWQTGG